MWDQSVSAMFCSQEKSRKLRPNSGSGCYHRLNQKEDRHTPRVHVLKAQYKWPFTCLYNLLIFFTSTSSMSAFLFFFRTFFLCLLWISSCCAGTVSWLMTQNHLRLESQFTAMMPKLQAAHPELFSSSASGEPEENQRLWMGKESALAGQSLHEKNTRHHWKKKVCIVLGKSPRVALLKAVELLLFTHL